MRQIFNAFYMLIFIKFLRTIAIRFSCDRVIKVVVPMGDDGYIVMATVNSMAEAVRIMLKLSDHRWSSMSVDAESGRVLATRDRDCRFYEPWATRYGTLPEYSVFDSIAKLLDFDTANAEELKHIALSLGQTPMTTVPGKFKRR